MHEFSETPTTSSLVQQQSVRDKCFHPTGIFFEFEKKDIEQSIAKRFEEQARNHSNRLAVKTRNQEFTYQELNETANRIARTIRMKSGTEGRSVALLFKHDALMIVAILGALKAGKIYVPLDASFPQARLKYILEDSRTGLLLTDNENQKFAEELAQDKHALLKLEDVDPDISTENLDLPASPDSPIYILYTSGSTGQPKGVVQSHRHRLHDIMIHTNGLHICAEDRLVLLYSCSTGMGTTVLFSALLNGASLYLYDLKEDGIATLPHWLKRHGITIYTSITTVLRRFLNALDDGLELPDLRLIYQSGEPLYKNDVDLYKKYFSPDCILINGMGSGEIARLRRYYIDKETVIPGNVVPIGYAVEDKEVLLLDENGEEIGFNHIGEIAVKSEFLSPGYWGKPDLTQAAFKSNPQWGTKRLFLTGDLGLMMSDGCLTHMGRKDFQVKISGNRVEIPEIEAVLYGLENVKEATVIAIDNGEGERTLAAYIVPDGMSAPSISTLRRSVAEKLPGFMVPSDFVFLDSMPHLPNGKLNRRALPAIDRQRRQCDESFVSPRNDLESLLAKLWQKTLKIPAVGIRDDFFDLGGSSLDAVSLALEVEKALGQKLPMATLWEARTIEQLAIRFRDNGWSRTCSSLVPIQPHGNRPPLFCIHGVGGCALFYSELAQRLEPHHPFYGLQAEGLEGEKPPFDRVEDMAAHYLREIRTVQPEGPYFLGGFCIGIYIALEMAQKLLKDGQKVSLLVAFNPPGYERMVTSFLNGIRVHLQRLSQVGTKQKMAYLIDRASYRLGRTRNEILNRLYELCRSRPSIARKLHYLHVQELCHRAGVNYHPGFYPGQIIFFLGTEDFYKRPGLFWNQVAGNGMQIYTVPGKGVEILMDPNVQILSQQLKICLDEALQDS